MKKTKKLRRLMIFQSYECGEIKEYLELMALQGWRLIKVGTFLVFEEMTPKKLTYAIEFFANASIFDKKPSNKTIEYIELCEAASWEHISTNGLINIFVTDKEDVIPIETDDELKYKAIKKSILKQNFINWFCLPLLFTLNVKLMTMNFTNYITSNISLIYPLITLLLIIRSVSQVSGYVMWSIKTKNRIAKGQPIEYLKHSIIWRKLPMIICFVVLLIGAFMSLRYQDYDTFICMLLALLLLGIQIICSYLSQKKQSSKSLSSATTLTTSLMIIVIMVFMFMGLDLNQSRPPLTSNDFGLSKEVEYSCYINESFLAKNVDYYQNDEQGLWYKIFESKYDFIIEKQLDDLLYNSYSLINAPVWQAKAVYKSDGSIIVVYENIIFIYGSVDIPENKIPQIIEKMNLN